MVFGIADGEEIDCRDESNMMKPECMTGGARQSQVLGSLLILLITAVQIIRF